MDFHQHSLGLTRRQTLVAACSGYQETLRTVAYKRLMSIGKETTTMLVLSRRLEQKVLFPHLGITVEVIGIRGRNVKLGIDAPPSVRIVRDELADDWDFEASEFADDGLEPQDGDNPNLLRHRLNNRLNSISLNLQLAEKLAKLGQVEESVLQIKSALQELASLNEKVASLDYREAILPGYQERQNRPTVLLVEDNANERQLLSTILKMSSIQVVTVANGEEALDYLKTHDLPDFVLIDMQMPRLNGPQTISIIRERLNLHDLPIYGVSGMKHSETNIPLGDHGVNGWFAKPVQAEQLLEQVFADCGYDDRIAINLN